MLTNAIALALWATAALALPQTPGQQLSSITRRSPGPDANGKYEITGKGIRAQFVPYGASVSNFFVKDISGIERDIVTGWDNASYYEVDKQHPHFGGVPGRYANRIKNSSFTIDGEEFKVLPNEHPTPEYPDGVNQLHGGPDGYDWRNWTVVAHTSDSITFSLTDPDGKEGFPGEVISYVTYTLGDMTWDIRMAAVSTTKKTPIMLSSHVYWNLDGFANNETELANNHSLWLPYGGQRVDVDSILIPTGDILGNAHKSYNDFWSAPKQLGADSQDPKFVGYDTCFLTSRPTAHDWRTGLPVARLRSPWSGIQLEIFTDQDAFQVYTCGGQNGSVALKSTQGLFDNADRPRVIPQYGCIVLEVQDYIDGINHPEWGRQQKQIFGPGDDPYVLQASYRFSLNGTKVSSDGSG